MYIRCIDDDRIISFFSTAKGASETPYMNAEVRESLGLTGVPWVRMRQVHGCEVYEINSPIKEDIVLDGYDALLTDVRGICLVTGHADCIPVQLYDPVRQVIAAVHAGWRGTALGIAQKTADLMRDKYGCHDIKGYIGPGISKCCFEVGPEVIEAFGEYPSCIHGDHVDLKEINRIQLINSGIKEVKVSDICTYCDHRYISYRRDNKTRLRMGSGICMPL